MRCCVAKVLPRNKIVFARNRCDISAVCIDSVTVHTTSQQYFNLMAKEGYGLLVTEFCAWSRWLKYLTWVLWVTRITLVMMNTKTNFVELSLSHFLSFEARII